MTKKKQEKTGFSDELQKALASLNESYGEGTLIGMDDSDDMVTEFIPTGSLILDQHIKGYPKGKIIEILGEESLGKSTLGLTFLAQFTGKPTLYIDSEGSLDRDYARRLGVDTSMMIVSSPETLEEGISILLDLVSMVEGVVFDSVAEFATKKEVEGDISDQDIGIKAKLMSKAIRRLKAKEHTATVMFINQTRENPGITYGSNRVSPGGKALRFASHLRLDLYGKEMIKQGEDIKGHLINLKVLKNKTGAPLGKLQIPIIYDGRGISREQEVIDLCIEKGIIEKSGSWLKYNGANLAQGLENARTFLIDNPELREELEQKLKS